MQRIMRILGTIPDPRQAWKVKHNLAEILLICILGVLANANSSSQIHMFAINREEWIKGFMRLENGIPSRLTIERVLCLLNPKAFQAAFVEIMSQVQAISGGSVVAIDGKSFFHEKQREGKRDVLYMVSAWCSRNGLTLGQVETREKSNEITAIPELLTLLDIKGATITIDAIGCQREIVRQIVKKNKADYLIALKGNQGNLHDELTRYAQDCIADPLMSDRYECFARTQKGHGRIETRKYYLFGDLSWFKDCKKWENLRSLVMVQSKRQVGNQEPTVQARYYITSLTELKAAAYAVRKHWGVENNLHWVLDVTFREDAWHTRKEKAAANLSHIRRLTANLLKADSFDNLSAPMKRYQCSLSLEYLSRIVFGHSDFS